jgi:hypothetical protein
MQRLYDGDINAEGYSFWHCGFASPPAMVERLSSRGAVRQLGRGGALAREQAAHGGACREWLSGVSNRRCFRSVRQQTRKVVPYI